MTEWTEARLRGWSWTLLLGGESNSWKKTCRQFSVVAQEKEKLLQLNYGQVKFGSFNLLCHSLRRSRESMQKMMTNGVEGWEEILEMVRGSQHSGVRKCLSDPP